MPKKSVPKIDDDLYFRLGVGFAAALCLSGCLSGTMDWQKLPIQKYQLKWTAVFNSPLTISAGINVDPLPQVSVFDLDGKLVTVGSYSVTLSAFADSQCTIPYQFRDRGGDNDGPPQSSTSSGVAQFTNLNVKDAVSFYVQASSDGMNPACSEKVTVLPGSPHHLANANPQLSVSVKNSTEIAFQVVDPYENPVVPASPIQVSFAITGPSGTIPAYSGGPYGAALDPLATGLSDQQGKIINRVFSSNKSGRAVVKATAASSPSVGFDLNPVVIPVRILPTAPVSNSILSLGIDILQNVTYWAKVIQQDTDGNVAYAPGSNTYFWNGSLFNLLIFSQFDFGEKWLPFSSQASPTGIAGLAPTPTTLTQAIGDSGVAPYCDPNFSPSSVNAVVTTNKTLSLTISDWQLSTNTSVSCVDLSSKALLFSGTGAPILSISGSQFRVGSGGRVQGDLNPNSILSFSGASSQVIDIDPLTGGVFFPSLESLTSPTAGSKKSLSIAGGPATVFGNFAFNGTSCGSSLCHTIFINNRLVFKNPLTIPGDAKVIIGPTGTLVATQGITLSGQMLIQGGGALVLGANQELAVDPAGASGPALLTLDGTPETGAPAIIDVDHSTAGEGTYSISFSKLSGGLSQLRAKGFLISNLSGNPGIRFSAGSQVLQMEQGQFTRFPSAGVLLKFEAGMIQNSPFNQISDVAFQADPKTNLIQALDGSLLNQEFYVLNSFFGFQPSTNGLKDLKSHSVQSNSPAQLLLFGE